MSRHYNQKLKILLLWEKLLKSSDPEHPIPMETLLYYLRQKGVRAERKALYDDIASLRLFGLDICHRRGKQGGYYLGSRDFEFSEIKLLSDILLSSGLLAEKKTEALLKKLRSLTSEHQAKALSAQCSLWENAKGDNEDLLFHIDCIQEALRQDRQIAFRYFGYGTELKKTFRNAGKAYRLSPFGLIMEDGYYYLLAYDGKAPHLKHYRVDRMEQIQILEEKRLEAERFSHLDPARYARQSFSMFGGEESLVVMEFDNRLYGAVTDRFGTDIRIEKTDPTHFRITVPVLLSRPFYGWIFSLGEGACILEPLKAIQGMEAMLKEARGRYRRIRAERAQARRKKRLERKEDTACTF